MIKIVLMLNISNLVDYIDCLMITKYCEDSSKIVFRIKFGENVSEGELEYDELIFFSLLSGDVYDESSFDLLDGCENNIYFPEHDKRYGKPFDVVSSDLFLLKSSVEKKACIVEDCCLLSEKEEKDNKCKLAFSEAIQKGAAAILIDSLSMYANYNDSWEDFIKSLIKELYPDEK